MPMGLNDGVHLRGRTASLPSESKSTWQRHDAGVSFTFTLFKRAAVQQCSSAPAAIFPGGNIPYYFNTEQGDVPKLHLHCSLPSE